jgi:hypothetical protein
MVARSFGEVISSLQRPLADQIAIAPLSTIEKTDVTIRRCVL